VAIALLANNATALAMIKKPIGLEAVGLCRQSNECGHGDEKQKWAENSSIICRIGSSNKARGRTSTRGTSKPSSVKMGAAADSFTA
jgi:hypothetical protein